MSADADLIKQIRDNTLAQLVEIRAQPKPTYAIDGQQVTWESYAESLQRTVDWCDQKLQQVEPFEITSRGFAV